MAACSGCGGQLPESGVYSVSVSLGLDATRRWRTCALACRLACLAAVVAEMQASAARREDRRRGEDIAGIMSARPAGRRS